MKTAEGAVFDAIALRRLADAKRRDESSLEANARNCERAEECTLAEARRLAAMLHYEREAVAMERKRLEKQGCDDIDSAMTGFTIIGVDEVGVGPLAGPIVSCAVALHIPSEDDLFGQLLYDGLNDSKKLKPAQREELDVKLRRHVRGFHIASVTPAEIAVYNPRQGSILAMERAVKGLLQTSALADCRAHVLVDYHTIPDIVNLTTIVGQTSMPKGDEKSQAIAAASVLAKVYRDKYMAELGKAYPKFGFDRNAGYGTQEHRNLLKRGILCPEHRLSYAPVLEGHRIAVRLAKEAAAVGEPAPLPLWWPEEEEEKGEKGESDGKEDGRKQRRLASGKGKGRVAARTKASAISKPKDANPSVPSIRKRKLADVVPDDDEVNAGSTAGTSLVKTPRAKRRLPLKIRAVPNAIVDAAPILTRARSREMASLAALSG